MLKNLLIFGIVLCNIILTSSCNNKGEKKEDVSNNNSISEYDSAQGRSFVYTKYELPLSVNVYKFLKSKNVTFNKQHLLNLKNPDKYFTEVSRALVLGVYSSDLAYSTIFDKSQEAVDYFGVSIELAHKLDIEQGYDSNLLDRVYDNMENDDSLSYIAGQAYWKTCNNLEQNNKTNILPFIVLGSWVESIHILTQASIGSAAEDGLFVELYNQKKHLGGMLNYLSDILSDTNASTQLDEMNDLVVKLRQIQLEYEKIDASDPTLLNVGDFKDVILEIEGLRSGIAK